MTATPLWRRLLAEFLGSCLPGGCGRRLRYRRPALVAGERGPRTARERGGYGRGPLRHHLDVRPVSGGHFNPVVSFVDAGFGGLSWRDAAAYLPAQVAGCISGAVVANAMFSLAALEISTKHRASGGTSCPRSWPRRGSCS